MKKFRFAWNGEVLSRKDTRWIIGTILIALFFLTATLCCIIFKI